MTSVQDNFNETKILPSKNNGPSKHQHKNSLFVLANFAPLIIDIVVGWS